MAARIGVTLLNFLAPGLGLLRIGRLRDALIAYGIVVAAFLILVIGFSTTENISFTVYAVLVSIVLIAVLVAYVLALWWTWRESRQIIRPRPIWSRWYSLIGALLVIFGVNWGLTSVSKSLYRNFYIPSEAMEPTLIVNDRILASMRPPKELHRGDILLVREPHGATYVKRLAALPGDRIALRDGVVFINGLAVPQVPHGSRRVSYSYKDMKEAKVYLERFPGEARPHLIQDLGETPLDDFPEVFVAPGHVFMLGDNRDDSADSRVSQEEGGLGGPVPLANILGRPLFFDWPRAKMGLSVEGAAP